MACAKESPASIICHYVDWEASFYLAWDLARKIKNNSGDAPDILVAISRGGLVPARVVADLMIQKNLLCLRTEHWDVATVLSSQVKIASDLKNIESKKILLIDDVADTGSTLIEVSKHLKKQGAASVETAVLHYKKTSALMPDYYAEQMADWEWIVYPWSLYEDTTNFIKKIVTDGPVKTMDIYQVLTGSFKLPISHKLFSDIIEEMISDSMIIQDKGLVCIG